MGKTEERTSKKDKKSGEKKSKKDKPSKAPKNEEQILEAHDRAESPADEPMAIDGPLEEEPKQYKKSSKKRRLEQDDAQLDTPADTTNSEAPKKKKKRKDTKTSDSGEPNAMSIDEPEVAPSENRKTALEDVSPSEPKRESKEEKKSRKDKKKASRAEPIHASDSEPTPAPTSEEAPAKPSSEPLTEAEEKKKRKKEKKEKKAKSTECDLPPSSPKKSKSKSSEKEASSPSMPRKNKTQFPNPEEDESLNPQALKALEYAFTQFNNPSEWKFNKAKQNWILRNVWSSESIPDTYLALAIKYIAQIQGGSREKLKETCRAAIVEPAPVVDVENTETTEVEAAGDGSKPKSILKPTSGQPVAGAIIAAVPAVPEVPTVDVKKERAQAILDALAESS